MLASSVPEHPVVSTRDATTVARLDSVVIDPARAAVAALRLRGVGRRGRTLDWRDVLAFGPDAVTVESAEVFGDPDGRVRELLDRDWDLLGKRLLSDAGVELGTVTDVEFDPVTGSVVSVIGTNGTIPGDRLVGCGSYAVVVRDT